MRWSRATPLALAALALALATAAPATARKGSAYGEYVRAARMLSEWRYDEARPLIERIAERYPRAVESRYLLAELSFLEGDYPGALERLDGIDDRELGGHVGALRSLAASTYEVTRDFAQHESPSGRFVIHYPPGRDEVIVELAGEVLDRALEVFAEDFGYTPAEKIRVEILSAPRDLARVSTLTEAEIETTGTIALCKYGKLMVVTPRATIFGYPWMDTLVHEYVHYVVSRMSHDRVPVWLHEGLARFQQTRWRQDPAVRLSAVDEHLLAAALKERRLIPFEQMHPSMAKLPSQEAAALAFAEVYTMVGYLHGKVGYEGIRRVIELSRDGKSATRAVAEVLDTRWSRVERDWMAHLRAQNYRTSRSLAGRAGSDRIRFDKGGDSDENVGLDEVGSAQARKFARLGGMLRARGMAEAAAIEYEKALAAAGGADPFVAAKLSRTYLELERYERAIELAEPLTEADESDAAPFATLGLAYLATGDQAGARGALEGALRTSPFDPAVRCALAEVYTAQGESRLAGRERAACTTLRR